MQLLPPLPSLDDCGVCLRPLHLLAWKLRHLLTEFLMEPLLPVRGDVQAKFRIGEAMDIDLAIERRYSLASESHPRILLEVVVASGRADMDRYRDSH